MAIDDLYEEDFYLWTQAQAEALRKRGAGGNAIDYDRLAEEVADLGKSEFREARSYVARIIEHLFKLAWSQREEPRGGWKAEIVRFRLDAEAAFTPTIRRKVEADLERLHEASAKAVALQFDALEPDAPRDAILRWTLPQILGERDDPIA
ncbi:MAG: DUF29 family protein [Alphaproteobacteria bacterium]|nr:DUF29 family protein [Alphaproteobacteria bacterium]